MIILGTNSIKDTGYDVDNSVRVQTGAYMSGSNGTATNNDKYTISFWVKRGKLTGTHQTIIEGFSGALNDTGYSSFAFRDTDSLNIGGYNTHYSRTNRVFRDISAWYHIVVAYDTTLGTADDRIKLYINGVEETSLSIKNNPTQNQNTGFNNNSAAINFFRRRIQSSNDLHGNGYFSEFCMIDGQQLDATSFGEFDDSGIWKPIDVSGLTFGNNGFYLDFKNSSSLGADVSGNTNNFTTASLATTDQSTDTCTNNFATFNPLTNRSGTTANHSEGNLKVTWSGGTNTPSMGTIGVQSGKWYYESKMFWGSNSYIGITYDSTPTNTDVKGYLLRQTGQKYDAFTGSGSSYTSALSSGDTVMIAFDADNGTLWFGVNGTWSNSATQTEIENGTTTNSAFSSIDMSYIWLPMGKGGVSSNARIEANFGSPIYSITSGNTDANGYGNFAHAVPSGYYSLNTKNLAEYG